MLYRAVGLALIIPPLLQTINSINAWRLAPFSEMAMHYNAYSVHSLRRPRLRERGESPCIDTIYGLAIMLIAIATFDVLWDRDGS